MVLWKKEVGACGLPINDIAFLTPYSVLLTLFFGGFLYVLKLDIIVYDAFERFDPGIFKNVRHGGPHFRPYVL